MPTYEYKCGSCGVFEFFQKITDQPLTSCPQCGGEVRRLISQNAGIIFKGSGFYITDHRGSDYAKKARGDSEKTKDSGGKDTKSENQKAS